MGLPFSNATYSQSFESGHLFVELDIGKDETILDIAFDFKGPQSWQSEFSLFCEQIRGKKLINYRTQKENVFFDLPFWLAHKAYEKWKGRVPSWQELKGDKEELVCRCFGVAKSEIISFLENLKDINLRLITDHLLAGGGCSECLSDLEVLLNMRKKELERTPLESLIEMDDLLHLWFPKIYGDTLKYELIKFNNSKLSLKVYGDEFDENVLKNQLSNLIFEKLNLRVQIQFT